MGRPTPWLVDVVPLASRDSGTGIFFFAFPLMLAGLIAAILLVQLPAWGIGRRVSVVAAVGVVRALASYFTPVGLHVLPGKPRPGSGCTARNRRSFDPEKFRIILFDQRNCGRSLPHASDPRG